MKIFFKIMFFFFVPLLTTGQDLPLYNQYLLNPYLLNPSVAGSSLCGIAQTTNRIQWLGIPNSPRIYSISYHQAYKKIGLGGYVYNDKNGLNSELGVQFSFAYHLNFSKSRKEIKQLSFGISYNGYQHSIDVGKFTYVENDPAVTATLQNQFFNNANAGINLFYNKYFVSFSAANLLPNKYTTNTNLTEPITRRNYFFRTGYLFPIKENINFEPSFVIKATEKLNSQIDINLKTNFIGKEYIIWFAVSFRRNIETARQQNISLMPIIGYETDIFTFGYAYDYGLSAIQSHNFGTHEIMLGYKICTYKKGSIPCPAYKNWKQKK